MTGFPSLAVISEGSTELAAAAPDWFTAAIGLDPEPLTVRHDGKYIEALTWGRRDAPGLLLMHGNMAHARWWSFIAPLLADRYRIAAFSFSGMGRSSHRPPYDLDTYAGEAMAVAEVAGLAHAGRFTVAGHSAGGGVAATLAVRHGGALRQAILIDSLIAPRDAPSVPNDKPSRVYSTREEAVARYRLVPAQPERNRFIIDWVAWHSLVQVDGGWSWSFDPWLRGHFTARAAWDHLPAAQCPLVFVNGASSLIVTRERVAALRERIPEATFLTIADAHHHVLIDQPLALAAVLGAILELGRAGGNQP